MIIASISVIYFEKDDYVQTVIYQRAGTELTQRVPGIIESVIADNIEQAVRMLRKNLQEYMMKNTILDDISKFNYFSFGISTMHVRNNRFFMEHGLAEINAHPLIGEIE